MVFISKIVFMLNLLKLFILSVHYSIIIFVTNGRAEESICLLVVRRVDIMGRAEDNCGLLVVDTIGRTEENIGPFEVDCRIDTKGVVVDAKPICTGVWEVEIEVDVAKVVVAAVLVAVIIVIVVVVLVSVVTWDVTTDGVGNFVGESGIEAVVDPNEFDVVLKDG